MKSIIRNILNLLFVPVLVVTAGCSSDILEEDVKDVLDGFDTIGYMAVRLMPADGADTSRASVGDEYDVGMSSEIALSNEANHYAIFYTEGQETPIAISELNGMSGNQSTDDKANSSMVYATIVGRNELREMLEKFNECYVILNTDIPISTLVTSKKTDLLDIRVNTPFFIDSKGVRYFTMCNSVYVDNGQKKIDTRVDNTKIYSSYQETIEQAWKGNAAVTAYVERLAAKFSLGFEKEEYNQPDADREFTPKDNEFVIFTHLTSGDVPCYADKDPATSTPYSYKIRLTGWGVNGLEQESFLFRNFKPQAGYFTGWYRTDHKRAFWSEDCNYDKAVYAWQYRKVIDNSGIPVYETGDNILKNYSYDELNANGFNHRYLYAPENTYDFADSEFSKSLNSRPELLAGSHIIVCAELLTNIDSPQRWEARDLYRDRNGSFYRNEIECVKALVASMNNTLKSHSYLKFTYWDWSKGGVEYKLFASTKGSFALYYKGRKLDSQYIDELYGRGLSLTADAEFKGSDGKRILWIDDLKIQDENGNLMQTYSNIDEVNSGNNEYLRESTDNDLKSVIFEHVGAVDHFSNGKMYYAIPIGYVENPSTSTSSKSSYSVYGVVRNSSYNILVTGVGGIGTSVDKGSQPIVPNTVNSSDHLFIGFKILDWHPIDQTVSGAIT